MEVGSMEKGILKLRKLMKKKRLKEKIEELEEAYEELQSENLDVYQVHLDKLKNLEICVDERKRLLIEVLKLDLPYSSSKEEILKTIKKFLK